MVNDKPDDDDDEIIEVALDGQHDVEEKPSCEVDDETLLAAERTSIDWDQTQHHEEEETHSSTPDVESVAMDNDNTTKISLVFEQKDLSACSEGKESMLSPTPPAVGRPLHTRRGRYFASSSRGKASKRRSGTKRMLSV